MRYAYEGWNLIAEWDIKTSPTKLVRSHHWGVDISGTRSGAGGVGGLVMTRHHTLAGVNGTKSTIPAYDGTGNILAYLDTADGNTVASYEYGPFGEPLRESGPLAKAHPHRWSSKYTDEETGFSYYGYRYYAPSGGRWLSRDPIGIKGGKNLHAFLGNRSISGIDKLGLAIVDDPENKFDIETGQPKPEIPSFDFQEASQFYWFEDDGDILPTPRITPPPSPDPDKPSPEPDEPKPDPVDPNYWKGGFDCTLKTRCKNPNNPNPCTYVCTFAVPIKGRPPQDVISGETTFEIGTGMGNQSDRTCYPRILTDIDSFGNFGVNGWGGIPGGAK